MSLNEEPVPKRLAYIDVLRLVAIFAVVVLHVAARAIAKAPPYSPGWMTGLVLDSLSRWSVPVFVMISGALLLGATRDEPIQAFLRRRFAKVLIPFGFWSLIYLGFRGQILHEALSPPMVLAALTQVPAFYHLWFMYVILGLYLITPLLRRLLQAARPGELGYFLWLWFGFSSLMPLCENLFGWRLGIEMHFALGYVGYFVLGHLLPQRPPLPRTWLWLGLALGASVTLGGTWLLTLKKHGWLDQVLFSYFSPNVVLMAVTVFWLFSAWPAVETFGRRAWLQSLSACSFGVYLLHPLVLALLLNTRLHGLRPEFWLLRSVWGLPLTSCLVFFASLLGVLLLRRLPLLQATVP